MRLIDADALKANRFIVIGDATIGQRAYVMFHEIDSAPSIDIVRCKECNYHVSRATKIDGMKYCERFLGWTYDTDYCAWGERRE